MPADLMTRINALRELETTANARRATAEANLALVKQRLEQTEAEIRALGVEPENAEQELVTIESQLEQAVTQLTDLLIAEIKASEDVIASTSAALK